MEHLDPIYVFYRIFHSQICYFSEYLNHVEYTKKSNYLP